MEFWWDLSRAFDLPDSVGTLLPAGFSFRCGSDSVDAQVRAVEFFFRIKADADQLFQRAVHQIATGERNDDAKQRADQLRHEADPAKAAQRLEAEDARRDATPCAAQAVQRPHARSE